MEGYDQYDINDASFDEFIDFLFAHPIEPLPEGPAKGEGPWYWRAEVDFIPAKVAGFYIRLFNDPKFLLSKFTREQLEQGFWAIISGNIECSITEIIWNREVPSESRELCVRSMYYLYESLFSVEPLDTSSNMWWDSIAYDWDCGNRNRENGGDDERMQDVMFETLGRILSLTSEHCQVAALHGLGHLNHPETAPLIQKYLESVPLENRELREYALDASRFDVM